ncbi:MAG: glycine zipper 2TM domain-containing protein, partial [Gammaproteobacteria bacterium]|nr:glycine zipper 2TM domain-containing protein [Gammaproteobacteria bacterium]
MLVGAVFGAVAATAGAAVAGYRYLGPHEESAKVLDVVALQKTLRTPRQVCHDEAVTRVAPPRDQQRLAGTGIGALVGGLLGNRIGDGSGQVLATVAGAAAGGYAGNRIERRMQQGNTY